MTIKRFCDKIWVRKSNRRYAEFLPPFFFHSVILKKGGISMNFVSWSDLVQVGILLCNVALVILNRKSKSKNKRK